MRQVCGSSNALMFLLIEKGVVDSPIHAFVVIFSSFLPCSENICMAVTEMAALFPKVRRLPRAARCRVEGFALFENSLKESQTVFTHELGKMPGE